MFDISCIISWIHYIKIKPENIISKDKILNMWFKGVFLPKKKGEPFSSDVLEFEFPLIPMYLQVLAIPFGDA